MSDVQAFWDQRFTREGYTYGVEPNELLVEDVGHLPAGGRVVSLGEGEGRNAVFLAARGFRVTAIEGSSVGIAKARELAKERGVSIDFVHGDLTKVELPKDADAFVSIFCHLPSAVRKDVHRRAWASLRPGGVFVICAYRPDQLKYATGGPKDLDMLVRLEDVREDFAGGEELVGVEVDRNFEEGPLHTGIGAVVHGVYRKR